ncbi:hypothetical protein NX722_06290 [Endozoicomonas gorgoniicola]|uniref:Uncharacterized protein n=1 Tax=Endozoicomonas gorgoniicola TaxID=1234144 RepID=A0ABT3MSC3_9GAMM|nr:hypothetical protein [Endozoicomonas gorgoniicola]MCW7552263.1 hypothetical protein [Endozoicomonas gorgoniicola]
MNRPLKLNAAEAGMLKTVIRTNGQRLDSTLIPAGQFLGSGQFTGFEVQLFTNKQLLPAEIFPLQTSPGLTFSVRPGFEYPFLIIVSEKAVNLRHLRVDASNLPPTHGGCYLPGVNSYPEGFEAVPKLLNLQSPLCLVYNRSGLLANGKVPMLEAVKGGRPSRRMINQANNQKKEEGAVGGAGNEPPPPPPGGSSGATGGDGGGGDDRPYKKDSKRDDAKDIDDEDEDEDEKVKGRKKNKKGRRVTADLQKLEATFSHLNKNLQRTYRKGDSKRRIRGFKNRDTVDINRQLAKATDEQWDTIVRMEGFANCQQAFELFVPEKFSEQFGGKSSKKPSPDEPEDSEESTDEGAVIP